MTNLRTAARRRSVALVVAVLVAVLVAGGACGDDGEAAPATTERPTTTTEATTTSTAPPRPTSTTTTMFDPASVEGEIEAAYLRSWEVYAHAVYHLELDEAALASAFTGQHLETKRNEIRSRIEDRRAAHVRVEHDYTIQVLDETTAVVVDTYRNHQVLIDPQTKVPIEEDPDELISDVVTLRFEAGAWRVSFVEELG